MSMLFWFMPTDRGMELWDCLVGTVVKMLVLNVRVMVLIWCWIFEIIYF